MITKQDIDNSGATVWNDVLNLENMVSNPVTDLFKPQYTITGNKIDFRGLLYVPLLDGGGLPVDVTQSNSYLYVPSAVTDNGRMTIIANANNNNGTPQGRFCTPDVVLKKNLPLLATPQLEDIVIDDVPAYRRYATGLAGILTLHRTIVSVRICGLNTPLKDALNNFATGCIGIISPYGYEYDGSGSVPSGNDPYGLLISRATTGLDVVDYISATDNIPFAVPDATTPRNGVVNTSPFSIDAHNITSMGGFIINLNGKNGFLK